MAETRMLCFIDGEGIRGAAIVQTLAEVQAFIQEQWTGPWDHPEDHQWLLDDLLNGPDENSDQGELTFEFETGYMTVTQLGDTSDPWPFGGGHRG